MRADRRVSPFRGQRGLSIAELVVGVTIIATASAISYRAFLFFNSQTVTQKRVADGQSQLIPIQAALEKNLRRASELIPIKAPKYKSPTPHDTIAAVVISPNGSSPDGIKVRGNFSGTSTRVRTAFPRAAASLAVTTGTAGGFSAGDEILLDNRDFSEIVVVSAVNTGTSSLTTGPRIYDYDAGAGVVRISSAEFSPIDTNLNLIADGKTFHLSKALSDLRFYCVQQDGAVDSVAPFDVASLKSIVYRVKIRVRKARSAGFLYREATGRVFLRNVR